MKLNLNSIYLATEGEGVHIGTPQIFVRFQGCAIGCLNCDSVDTWSFDSPEGLELSLEETLVEISKLGEQGTLRRVSITGGDPLHPKNLPAVIELTKELKKKRYWVNIEAAGTRVPHELFDLVDFVSFDFKTPSTGVVTRLENILKVIDQYSEKFQIKSVIETPDDFKVALKAKTEINKVREGYFYPWCLTPSYNLEEAFPKERFENVIKWNEENGMLFRVIGQQHKWIFGPDQKQV